MKIAITSQGETLDSQVDPRFGRAAMFIIYDTETGDAEPLDNKQNLQAAQGAGIQAGQKMANAKVEAVLTGHCGPKAFKTLEAAGIKVYTGAEGKVSDAVEAFKSGKMDAAAGADVEGHWQ